MSTHGYLCIVCRKESSCVEEADILSVGGGCESLKSRGFCSMACFMWLFTEMMTRIPIARREHPDWFKAWADVEAMLPDTLQKEVERLKAESTQTRIAALDEAWKIADDNANKLLDCGCGFDIEKKIEALKTSSGDKS